MTTRATLAGLVAVLVVALGAFAWREVRNANSPPTAEDLCQFAANSVMLEQWTIADSNVDPIAGAKELFGSDAKRRWTEKQAEELADNIDSLRQFVDSDLRVQVDIGLWLGKAEDVDSHQPYQRDRVRGVLFSYCLWKKYR